MPISAIESKSRSHIQHDLKHLVRDVRKEVKAELKELRASGEGDPQKIAAVRSAYAEFRAQVQDAFLDAGDGGSFNAAAVPEGLRQAMISFTGKLRALNGMDEVGAPAPADEPQKTPDDSPSQRLDLAAGMLVDLNA